MKKQKYIKIFKINAVLIIIMLILNMFFPLFNNSFASSTPVLVFSNNGITESVAGTGYTITDNTLEIEQAGTYKVSGTCNEGNIEVKKGVTGVELILDNLQLTSSTTAPLVIKKEGASVTLKLIGTSTLTNKENPDNENSTDATIADAFEGAAIKVKSNSQLFIKGTGTLDVDGSSCKNGIKGGAETSITINGGTLNVNAANTGIACDGTLTINGGTVNVTSAGDGIKSEPDSTDTVSAGAVAINGGNITVNAQGDGIQAAKKLTIEEGSFNIKTANGYTSNKYTGETSCKGLKASTNEQENVESEIEITGGTFTFNTADDAIHSDAHVKITGGTFSINTGDDAVHADTSLILGKSGGFERDPEITINHCYEGLEAGTVYAYSGKYWIIATDDAINAAGGTDSGETNDPFKPGGRPGEQSIGSSDYNLYIYGGDFYAEVASGDHDGLDSNGGLYLLGGNITMNGGTAPLDSDGTMKISGATVFLAGSDNMGDISLSSDSQGYISQGLKSSGGSPGGSGGSSSSVAAGKIVNVYDASNNIVYSQKLKVSSSVLLYSSPSTMSNYSFNTSASSITNCKSDSWKHSWNDGVITKEATQTSDGVMTYTCTSCGATERKTVHYSATESLDKYSLTDQNVILKGNEDAEVEITLISEESATFDGMEANWSTKENEDTSYFTLTSLIPGADISPAENSATTGKIVWADTSGTGFSVDVSGTIWSAKYKVDKDTPEGEYTVGLDIAEISKESTNYDENISLTAKITVQRDNTPSQYTATFNTDSGVEKINVYHTKNYETVDEEGVTSTYARDADTGEVDVSGNGQINFLVVLKNGATIDEVTVSGNYKNIKDSADTGVENLYRITKVAGDLTINIKTKSKTSIVPEVKGLLDSYVYTGTSIKPEITLNIYGEQTTLVKDKDYTIEYGTNTNVGTGTVTIKPVDTSEYTFTEKTENFSITAKEITENNVTVPNSIIYTGETLYPEVTVKDGEKSLIKDTDYTVSYSGEDGNIGDSISVKVEGKGNYKGIVSKTVTISDKPSQTISFAETAVTKTYGDSSFTKTANKTVGDGTINYSSSNTKVATVDNTGKVTIVGVGETTITAIARATQNYAETSAIYVLTVNKKAIAISAVEVNNKEFDGNTSATISKVNFNGLVGTDKLEKDTDYTVTATFENATVGTSKDVRVELTLKEGETTNNYTLSSNIYLAKANITAVQIKDEDVTLGETTYSYDGKEKKPSVVVKIGDKTLVNEKDYTLNYNNNISVGTAIVTIKGINNYSGTVNKEFTISKKSITPVIADIEAVTYNGEEQKPKLTVTESGNTLVEGIDYTVSYSKNINAGTGTATVKSASTGNYTFTDVSKNFTINKYKIASSDVTLSYTTIRYDGTEKRPDVTVTVNGKVVDASNYTVEYSNNKEVGTAKVTLTITGSNYEGSVEKTFEIADKLVLEITGIENNQKVTYTGNEVILTGTLTVSNNNNGITAKSLTTKWLDKDGKQINKPVDAGSYSVIYSYSDNDYTGNLTINFEITKAKSELPSSIETGLTAIAGQKLSDVELATNGLVWNNENTVILEGNNTYSATYLKNNDAKNYTSESVSINVYGKKYIDINTVVNGTGGTISESLKNVLEGTTKTITFTPNEGYEIDNVTVNGKTTTITNNKLNVTAETDDLEIIVKYKVIQYTITVTGDNVETNTEGVINVNYNSNKEITIYAKYGYKLTSILVNNKEMIDKLENNKISLLNINTDTTIIAKAEKIVYNYIDGAEQTYTIETGSGATFGIDAEYSLFDKVYVDNELVNSSNYTSKSGSTIITFNENYLDNLQLGVHNLKVVFSDGGEANTTFTIASLAGETNIDENQGNSESGNENNLINTDNTTADIKIPNTGDKIKTFILLAIISLAVLITLFGFKNKKYKDIK